MVKSLLSLALLLFLSASTPTQCEAHPLQYGRPYIAPSLRNILQAQLQHRHVAAADSGSAVPGLPGYTLTTLQGAAILYVDSPSGNAMTVNLVFHGDVNYWKGKRVGKWKRGRRLISYLEGFFKSMSSEATSGTLKDYLAAMRKNYPGSNGPLVSKINVTTVITDYMPTGSPPDPFVDILNHTQSTGQIALNNNTISFLFTSPDDPAVNKTAISELCSTACYGGGLFGDFFSGDFSLYYYVPGCPACTSLPPSAGVTRPPLVTNATAALTLAVANAFVGQVLAGPTYIGGYFLTNDTAAGLGGDFRFVSEACQDVYPGLKASSSFLPKGSRWQYNLKGMGNTKYLLPGVLQNSTLTCEIK